MPTRIATLETDMGHAPAHPSPGATTRTRGRWHAVPALVGALALLTATALGRDTPGALAPAEAAGALEISAASYNVALPLLVRSESSPDLIASLSLSPDKRMFAAGEPVTLIVKVTNQGGAAAGPFWVDLYINPSSPPTAANQTWYTRCALVPCFGMAWQVPGGLAPGESVTLSSQSVADSYSAWRGWLAAGTTDLYTYADSYQSGGAAGAVAESDEGNNRAELHGLSVSGPNPESDG